MKPEYNLCDKCNKNTQLSIILTTGRGFDGVETVDTNWTKDLCGNCLRNLTQFILNKLLKDPKFSLYESHQEILKWIEHKNG